MFVTIGLFLILALFLKFYFNVKIKWAGFPFDNFLPSLIYDFVTGKIPKDVPINSIIFQRIIDVAKRHTKEGLCVALLTRPVLLVFGEKALKVFETENAVVGKTREYKVLEEALGDGLVTSNGNRWKTHRKIIDPAFHMSMLKEKVHLFNEHAMALIKDMEKLVAEPYVDLAGIFKKHYFNALYESVLGLKENKKSKERFLKLEKSIDLSFSLVVQRIFFPWLCPKFLLSLFPTGRLFKQAAKEIDDIINSIFLEMRSHAFSPKSTNSELFSNHFRKSVSYILLKQHLKDPSFTLKDVHEETKTILLAGYDTVSWSTVWCLFLLGLHPDIQQKAFQEVALKTSDLITYEESCTLEYLNAIIMETLRIYPVVPLFGRQLIKDAQIGKNKISKGTSIVFFPYMLHRDSNIYPDPEKFEPERFLNGDSKKSGNFIPFAEINRSCIGKNYALTEMKIFLGHILRNFEIISLDKRDNVSLNWGVFLKPVKPLRMIIRPRRTSFTQM